MDSQPTNWRGLQLIVVAVILFVVGDLFGRSADFSTTAHGLAGYHGILATLFALAGFLTLVTYVVRLAVRD